MKNGVHVHYVWGELRRKYGGDYVRRRVRLYNDEYNTPAAGYTHTKGHTQRGGI